MADLETAPPPQGNDLRGEVDLVLEGERFVLRPSHAAIQAIEKDTGKTMVQLAIAADDQALSLADCAVIVGETIRAWGNAVDHDAAKRVNNRRLGELIYEHGLLAVMPRISLVLTYAATGGCLASGELRTTGTATTETPVVD